MSEETSSGETSDTIVTSTIISQRAVSTPTINTNNLNAYSLNFYKLGSLTAETGYIKELTVDVLNINDGETDSSTENSETTEQAQFGEVNLNFADEYNCVYMMAGHNILTSNTDGYELNINFTVPQMGSKVVCRYLVLDLREIDYSYNLLTTWPEIGINWLYGTPDIQAGYFYVLAFQRFAEDLIIGNVAVKIEGVNA